MPKPKKTYSSFIENDYCQFWIDEKGIMHEIFKNSFDVLTLEVAEEIVKCRIELCKGQSYPLYVELGEAHKMERRANKYLSTGEAMTYLTATAILVRDQMEKLGATLYTTFYKPTVPTKFFTNKKEALAWLEQFGSETQN